MTIYTVTSTIQSKDRTNPPVDMKHYTGTNLAVAISAAASAATLYEEPTHPLTIFDPDVLSVRIDFEQDMPLIEALKQGLHAYVDEFLIDTHLNGDQS